MPSALKYTLFRDITDEQIRAAHRDQKALLGEIRRQERGLALLKDAYLNQWGPWAPDGTDLGWTS